MKKYLVVDYWDASPHLETSLEICIKLSSTSIVYYGNLSNSTIFRSFKRSAEQAKARNKLVSDIVKKNTNIILLSDTPSDFEDTSLFCLPNELTVPNLLTTFYNGIQVGNSLVASFPHKGRLSVNPFINNPESRDVLSLMAASYSQVYRYISHIITKYDISDLFVCNGIHLHSHASCAAAKNLGVSAHYHERGQSNNSYLITHDNPPHSLNAFQKAYFEWLRSGYPNLPDIKGTALKLFKNFIENSPFINDDEIVKNYQYNMFAERLLQNRGSKLKYTLFTSSDAESISSGHANHPPGGWWSQAEFLLDFMLCYRNYIDNIDLTIRIHPNMANYASADLERTNNILSIAPCRIVQPYINESSYQILAESDIVFSYGSTIGLEASYLGIPSFSAAPSEFRSIKLTQTLSHPSQIVSIFESSSEVVEQHCAPLELWFDNYAAFLNDRDTSYTLYKASGFSSGELLSVCI